MCDAPDMISKTQMKAARLYLGWDQRDLAAKAKLSLPTIQRMERLGLGRSTVDNAERVQGAMESAGIEFLRL